MKKTIPTLLICCLAFTVYGQDKKAVSYKELQNHLPDKIAGFSVTGEPDGQSLSMNGMSYSMAAKSYNSGGVELNVTIMDYQGAASLYTAATMAWAMGMEYEDDDKKVSSYSDGDFNGIIEIGKKREEVNLTTGYKDRYLILIELDGSEDESTAKKVLKDLKLSDLP